MKFFWICITTLLITVAIVLGWLYLLPETVEQTETTQKAKNYINVPEGIEIPTSHPTGDIYVSGALVEDGAEYITTHKIAVSDKETEFEFFRPSNLPGLSTEFLKADNINDFFIYTISKESLQTDDHWRVHKVDRLNRKVWPIQNLGQVKAYNERYLAWSDSAQLLAYSKQLSGDPDSDRDFLTYDNWKTVLLDPATGDEVEVGRGGFPMWDPAGKKLLYVDESGMYAYTLETAATDKVLTFEEFGTLDSVNKINISPNGKYIVHTIPKRDLIVLYEVTNWDVVEVKEFGRIHNIGVDYYWPVFSPDSQYYVVQAIGLSHESESDTDRFRPRLEMRHIYNQESVWETSLEQFDFLQTFTDDWTE